MTLRTRWLAISSTLACLFVFLAPSLSGAEEKNATPRPQASPTDANGDYRIGPGDVLDISVWKEPDLTRQVIVLPDGRISFPLIGQVMVQGLTLAQLKAEIEKQILRYVPNPNLSVSVHQINSLHVYVLGKVNNPGRFELNANINVLQALAMAGGFNPFADEKEIKVFREEAGQTLIFDFNYTEVTKGQHLEQNRMLKRGDVIVVP